MTQVRSLAVLALASLGVAALAQPFNYAQRRANVHAGVAILRSQPTNLAPHVWFALDQDPMIRPAGWTFANPMGVTTLTEATRTRWVNAGATGVPAAGTQVTKRDGPYWEVNLSAASDRQLAQFQVLLLPVASGYSVAPDERERLRNFVDGGGLLWMDVVPVAGTQDLANPGPLPFLVGPNSGALSANLQHPLLSIPNPMSLDDVSRMNFVADAVVSPFTLSGAGLGGLENILSWVGADSFRMQGVAGNAGGRTIQVGRLGDGMVVVTARAVSRTLMRGLAYGGGGPNIVSNFGNYRSFDPVYDAAYASAAKLVVNMISGLSNSRGPAGGSRKTSSTPISLAPPLLQRFQADLAGLDAGKPPVVVNGFVVAAAGDRLVVYGADPSADLDGNGDPDDGRPDELGFPGDAIWRSAPMGGAISAPVVAEVPNSGLVNPSRGGAAVTQQVWVTDSQGRAHVFDLQDNRVDDVPPLRSIDAPDASVANSAFAPTVHESLLLVADRRQSDGFGRVWAIDLATASAKTSSDGSGAINWRIQGSGLLGGPSASPTVGYVPSYDGAGGLDRVVYVPTQPEAGATVKPAGFASLWLGARGEQPTRLTVDGTTLRVETRARARQLPIYLPGGADPLGPKVSIVDSNGVPIPAGQLSQYLDGSISSTGIPGEFQVGLGPLGASADWINGGLGLRIDYTIDWGTATGGMSGPREDAFVRGVVQLPDDTAAPRHRIQGHLALTRRGDLAVVSAPPSGWGGAVFLFREVAPGRFDLRMRWDLHGGFDLTINNAQGSALVPPAIRDESALRSLFPILNRELTGVRFVGGPTVTDAGIYVLAQGGKNLGFAESPTSVLLCFDADPSLPEFYVDNLGSQFSLVQPDPMKDASPGTLDGATVLTRNAFEATQEGASWRITLNSLMDVPSGAVKNAISQSLPIVIRQDTDTLIEPEATVDANGAFKGRAGGRFSPLQWFAVIDGFETSAAPIVAGQSIFVPGGSYLAGIIQGQIAARGAVYGFDALVSGNDPFLKASSQKPWQSQLNLVVASGGIPTPWTGWLWPQFRGVRSFDDLRIRILQAAIDESRIHTVAAGDGVLVALGTAGLYGFDRADFLVVDEGRVSRIDAAGNPIWSTQTTQVYGSDVPTVGATRTKPLSVPNRAYPGGDNGLWIVDTGNDRVVRTDASGRELRSIGTFRVHPNHPVRGRLAGESRTLRQPKDVLAWTTLKTQAEASAVFGDAAGPELWEHTLIADSGNYRVVEVVDRFRIDPLTGQVTGVATYVDPTSDNPGGVEPAFGVLLWQTPEEFSGKRYAYNSIARTYIGSGVDRRSVVAFGFGSPDPGRASLGLDSPTGDLDTFSGYGGVVLYDGDVWLVIDQYETPAIPAGSFLLETSPGTWEFASTALASVARPINGLQSVTLRPNMTPEGARLTVMVADVHGVYELYQPDPTGAPDRWVVRWMLPNEAYTAMRRPAGNGPFSEGQLTNNPMGLRAKYARRLDNGDVLVVNGYYGRRFGGGQAQFTGEVVVIDGRIGGTKDVPGYGVGRQNLGFGALSIQYEIPPIQGFRGLVNPVFAERQ